VSWFSRKKVAEQLTCAEVVTSYGAVLEQTAESAKQIHPTSILPYEKPIIEAALLHLASQANTNVPASTLKAGYMQLSTFQDGMSGVEIDWTKSPPTDREEIAKFMAEVGPNLAQNAGEADFLLKETLRLSQEWDFRLAKLREQANA
jgi:hypothetical protein